MLKFSASILGRETPVYDGGSVVALTFECVDLPSQRHFIADTTLQTLVAEDTDLDLRHVQPTSMLRSVMKLQTLGDAPVASRSGCVSEDVQAVNVRGLYDRESSNSPSTR